MNSKNAPRVKRGHIDLICVMAALICAVCLMSAQVCYGIELPTTAYHTTLLTPRTDSTTKKAAKKKSSDDADAKKDTKKAKKSKDSKSDKEEQPTHPLSYTWDCGQDYDGIAPEDGSLSEWAPHYYVAHAYGEYGKAILGLEPGDEITVNGNLVTVEGAITMPMYSPYEDVMREVGWDATVFQTCVPDSDDCRFVYARGDCSTQEAADEARQWAGIDRPEREHFREHFFDRPEQDMIEYDMLEYEQFGLDEFPPDVELPDMDLPDMDLPDMELLDVAL